jgi:hypothetical protein|tara:strand:- start:8317 stop:8457 length:141 start_codon:yes stop_codon:yes gene_type:complete
MIDKILELISITECNGKYSQIAKGKNKMPENLKEAYNQLKKELKNG